MSVLLASLASPYPSCSQSRITLVVFVLLLALPPGGDVAEAGLPTGWVCFDGIATTPVPPRIGIVSSGPDELVLNIETPGVLSTAVEEGELDFQKLEFPGYYRSTDVGHPALPAVRQLVAVPAGCTIDVSVSIPDSIRYSDSVVYPVPAIVTRYTEDGYEYLAEEFAYDEGAYSTRGYYPTQTASAGSVGILRGQGVALLIVYPIQFDASSDLIRVLPLVTVTLTFTGGYGGGSGDLGPFDSIAEGVLLNYEGSGARGGRAQADTGRYRRCGSLAACDSVQADYLMIVQDSLYASTWIDALAAHRATWNGYNVAIVSDDVLGAQISDIAIRDFIQDVYELGTAEHMSDGHLGYVLLVGDARAEEPYGYMPAHEQNAITTDHWYACVDDEDDDIADLMIGRLCASDTLELQTEVEKFVAYELNATSTQPSWRDTVLLSCGFAWLACDPLDLGMAATTDAAFDSVGVLVQGRYVVQEVHAHEQGPAVDCVEQYNLTMPLNVQLISEGCHIVEFCSHGCPNGLRTFEPDNVGQLENGDELPFWMSVACGSGGYDRYHDGSRDCLGERLLHQEESGGAIGYLGSTENSVASVATFLGMYVWEGILNDHHYEIGQFLSYAKLKHFSRTGDLAEVLKYNLLGDPALNLELTDHHGYGSAPDYVVTSSDLLSLPMFPSYYDTVHLSAVIHNISNYDPDPGDSVAVVFTVSERDGSDTVFVETTYVDPPAWSTRTAHVVWAQPGSSAIGEWLFAVEIDTSGVELFKDNNSAQGPLCIYFERPGFDPYNLHASGATSPTIADINGAAGVEVVVAASDPGRVVALSSDGDSLWAFPVPEGLSVRGPASVGDLDFHGDPEVIVCYGDSVLALSGVDGRRAWTQPCRVRGLKSGATLADLEAGDGRLEVVAEGYKTPMHLDSHTVTVAAHDGTDLWEYVALFGPQLDFPTTCPAVADLDGDGESEVVSSFLTDEGPHVVALSGQSGVADWTSDLGGAPLDTAPCSPVIADVDWDSDGLEVLCGVSQLCCLDAGGTQLWSIPLPGAAAGCAVADVVGSAVPEIIVTVYAAADSATPCVGWLFVLDASGVVVDSTTVDYRCQNQPVIADLDGDSRWEIIVTSSCPCFAGPTWTHESHLEIFTYDPASGLGDFLDPPRPLFFRGRVASVPAAADTDCNGCPEIWLVDAEGYVHCLEWPGASGRLSRWSSFQHDERHTGTYETPVSGAYPESTAVSWWGDYLMTGDVLVHGTSSLVVQPGTTMRATASSDTNLGGDPGKNELIADGELLATGDDLRPTRFILEEGALGATSWRGIRLRPPSSVGKLHGCTIDQAFIGIDASNPDKLIAEGCTISRSEVKGISCWGNSGASSILLSGNTITSAQIGMELHGCRATVESNAITDCQSYGMKIYEDYGSSVHSNTLGKPHYAWGPFSGIYVQGSRDTLAISANQITDIKTTGIYYEWPVGEDQAEISGNTITGTGICTKGMYFYESGPLVRENTITDMNTGFWIQTDGLAPDLGDAEVSDGSNCVQIEDRGIQYYVRIVGSVQDSVKAERNFWWSKTGEPDSSKFSSWVDWDLWLDDCPNGRSPGQEDGDTDARLVFSLSQNHPNPFNPNTRIQFSVPRRTHVRLRIYDLTGRLVRTLVDDLREPGPHEVVWDGRDTRGVQVASGVYFCRLEAGGSVAARKLVLLK